MTIERNSIVRLVIRCIKGTEMKPELAPELKQTGADVLVSELKTRNTGILSLDSYKNTAEPVINSVVLRTKIEGSLWDPVEFNIVKNTLLELRARFRDLRFSVKCESWVIGNDFKGYIIGNTQQLDMKDPTFQMRRAALTKKDKELK